MRKELILFYREFRVDFLRQYADADVRKITRWKLRFAARVRGIIQ